MKDPRAEFDHYARDYKGLLRHPVRDRFSSSGEFYHYRKWVLIWEFLRRRGLAADELSWLDVGCGKGELLGYGRPYFRSVAGCDTSREMTRDTRGTEVRLQEVPAELPFESATFDLVTAVCVYHHVDEPVRVPLTREIYRILRPRGIFCIIEHNPFNPLTRLIVSQCPIDVDAHLLSARQAKAYVKQAALHHLESQYFLYLPKTMFEKAGSLELLLKNVPAGGQYAVFSRK